MRAEVARREGYTRTGCQSRLSGRDGGRGCRIVGPAVVRVRESEREERGERNVGNEGPHDFSSQYYGDGFCPPLQAIRQAL